MLKKVLITLCVLFMLCASVFAMILGQPIKIGSAGQNSANSFFWKTHGAILEQNGISKFGNVDDCIYFYQYPAIASKEKHLCGGKNVKNTFLLYDYGGCDFYQIKSDSGITLYMIYEVMFDYRNNNYILLGKQKDGTFVKYFDALEVASKFCGSLSIRNPQRPYFIKGFRCEGNSILIPYSGTTNDTVGEFRFKWDDKAQWYGVERVVY